MHNLLFKSSPPEEMLGQKYVGPKFVDQNVWGSENRTTVALTNVSRTNVTRTVVTGCLLLDKSYQDKCHFDMCLLLKRWQENYP